MKKYKIYSISVTVISLLSIIAFLTVFFHGGYLEKILVKFGFKERQIEKNWAVFSWESCLDKLEYDADIVFLGDSLTRGGDFQEFFNDKKIVNLGYSGDTVSGMLNRISMIKSTTPEKVFIMGGINSLTKRNIDLEISEYEKIIITLQEICPETTIYIQSVLPTSNEKETSLRDNETIDSFNLKLQKLCKKYNLQYIDLFSVFLKNGELNSDLSSDGIHINSKGYDIWYKSIQEFIR